MRSADGVHNLAAVDELRKKLALVRAALAKSGLSGVRFRGTGWFAWATCGGSNVVLLTTDVGVAEVLVTADDALVLTDEIEAPRLVEEELPPGYQVFACRWIDRPAAWNAAVRERTSGGKVASDRPIAGEVELPDALVEARASLLPEELARYSDLGRAAAEAMTEVLLTAKPEWSGWELAGAGAEALWARGIEPALTLVGGERRLPVHRHATASKEKLGRRAMLVFCARRHGLFANLTRFVYFSPPGAQERATDLAVAQVEAAALDALRPGVTLSALYDELVRAYARTGHAGAERAHHQGGTCGYDSRDALAVPGSRVAVRRDNAVAFNPSLPGAKIEDTIVVRESGLSILTTDPRWPTRAVNGRPRPDLLVR